MGCAWLPLAKLEGKLSPQVTDEVSVNRGASRNIVIVGNGLARSVIVVFDARYGRAAAKKCTGTTSVRLKKQPHRLGHFVSDPPPLTQGRQSRTITAAPPIGSPV